MPEGHTIHRLALDHRRDLRGQRLAASSPQGRFAEGAAAIDGRVLERVEPYGKHLFYWFGAPAPAPGAAGVGVHVHLGLYGKFSRSAAPAGETQQAVRLRLASERWVVDLVGPTACELVTPAGRDALVARLGPDLLDPRAHPERAWRALARRRSSVGQALLDQSVVAGVGNVYRAEALFVLGIHPLRPANTLAREEFDALWATLTAMLRKGVRDRRIVTVDPADVGKPPRARLAAAESRYVYGRPACLRCATPVRRWDLAGRWAYACERCQPPPA